MRKKLNYTYQNIQCLSVEKRTADKSSVRPCFHSARPVSGWIEKSVSHKGLTIDFRHTVISESYQMLFHIGKSSNDAE